MQKSFSQKKFLSLATVTRHKQAAKILREFIQNDLGDSSSLLARYDEICRWTKWDPLEGSDFQTLSDKYHWHMQSALRPLKEHNLLKSITKKDRPEGAAPLSIAIFLDNIRSAHNVGSILRTTEAFALGSIYFSPKTAFIDHKQVQDASMGTFQWVSCHQNAKLSELPKPIIVLETSSRAQPLFQFDFPDKFTLVIGNEEYGCSEESLKNADTILEIPLCGRKNSLNVANAYAIAAAYINHQKRFVHSLPLNHAIV